MDDLKDIAKLQLNKAWDELRLVENTGLVFGKLCYEWSLRLGELYPLYKEIGIRPTDANWWMEKYKQSVGLKELHKEKSPNRSALNTLPELQSTAISLLNAGFDELSKRNPDKTRLYQSAKDWGRSLLNRTDL